MTDRFPIRVKFEVMDGLKKLSVSETPRLQKKNDGSVKKDGKFKPDLDAPRTSSSKPSRVKDQSHKNIRATHRERVPEFLRTNSSSIILKTCLGKKQPMNPRTETKNAPIECATDRKPFNQIDGTSRKPRDRVSASNFHSLKADRVHSTGWVFPLSASLDRELTLIDLDVKYSSMKKQQPKAQVPPSLIPRDKNKIESYPESASRRPRSCNSSSGSVRRLSFPTVACDRIHGTDWIFRAGNISPVENSSLCRMNSGVRNSDPLNLREACSLTTASDWRGRSSGTIIPGAFFDYALFNQED